MSRKAEGNLILHYFSQLKHDFGIKLNIRTTELKKY